MLCCTVLARSHIACLHRKKAHFRTDSVRMPLNVCALLRTESRFSLLW